MNEVSVYLGRQRGEESPAERAKLEAFSLVVSPFLLWSTETALFPDCSMQYEKIQHAAQRYNIYACNVGWPCNHYKAANTIIWEKTAHSNLFQHRQWHWHIVPRLTWHSDVLGWFIQQLVVEVDVVCDGDGWCWSRDEDTILLAVGLLGHYRLLQMTFLCVCVCVCVCVVCV